MFPDAIFIYTALGRCPLKCRRGFCQGQRRHQIIQHHTFCTARQRGASIKATISHQRIMPKVTNRHKPNEGTREISASYARVENCLLLSFSRPPSDCYLKSSSVARCFAQLLTQRCLRCHLGPFDLDHGVRAPNSPARDSLRVSYQKTDLNLKDN